MLSFSSFDIITFFFTIFTYLSISCLTGPFGTIRWDNCVLPLPAKGRVLGLCDWGSHWLYPGYHQGSTAALPCPQDCQRRHRRKDSGMQGHLGARRTTVCHTMIQVQFNRQLVVHHSLSTVMKHAGNRQCVSLTIINMRDTSVWSWLILCPKCFKIFLMMKCLSHSHITTLCGLYQPTNISR